MITSGAVSAPPLHHPRRVRPRHAHPHDFAGALLKTWRVLHTDYRRPLDTFATTISAVLGLESFRMARE